LCDTAQRILLNKDPRHIFGSNKLKLVFHPLSTNTLLP